MNMTVQKLNHLSSKIRVNWHDRVLHIMDFVSLSDVQIHLKSTLFLHSKFRVPILDHSQNGKVTPNLIMDEGWKVIGAEKVSDAKWVKNVYENSKGEKVSHYIFWPKTMRKKDG